MKNNSKALANYISFVIVVIIILLGISISLPWFRENPQRIYENIGDNAQSMAGIQYEGAVLIGNTLSIEFIKFAPTLKISTESEVQILDQNEDIVCTSNVNSEQICTAFSCVISTTIPGGCTGTYFNVLIMPSKISFPASAPMPS